MNLLSLRLSQARNEKQLKHDGNQVNGGSIRTSFSPYRWTESKLPFPLGFCSSPVGSMSVILVIHSHRSLNFAAMIEYMEPEPLSVPCAVPCTVYIVHCSDLCTFSGEDDE